MSLARTNLAATWDNALSLVLVQDDVRFNDATHSGGFLLGIYIVTLSSI